MFTTETQRREVHHKGSKLAKVMNGESAKKSRRQGSFD